MIWVEFVLHVKQLIDHTMDWLKEKIDEKKTTSESMKINLPIIREIFSSSSSIGCGIGLSRLLIGQTNIVRMRRHSHSTENPKEYQNRVERKGIHW